jgi:hypothetical protein
MLFSTRANAGTSLAGQSTASPKGRVKVEFGLATAGLWESNTAAYFKKILPELPGRWLRVHRIYWDYFEPIPPRNGIAQYDWEKFDKVIMSLQEMNIEVVYMIHPTSQWAADPGRYRRARSGRKPTNVPPKPENIKHWQRALQDLFDRYNHDGKNDMPGLKKPFKHWQIGNEYMDPHYWDGTVQEYIEVLKAAYMAKKRVDPSIEIILTGIQNAGRIARYEASYAMRKMRMRGASNMAKFVKEMLKYPQYFDFIDVHVFNHFRVNPNAIPEGIDWLKNQMALNGYSKPYGALEWTAAMTYMDSHFKKGVRDEFKNKMKILLRQPSHPEYDKISKEFEIEQAKDFAKVFVTLIGYGLERNLYVQFRDLPASWAHPLWDKQGLVRARRRGGRIEGRKPVFYVFKRLLEKLSPWVDLVEKVDVKEGVYAWRFLREKRKMVVAWSDNSNQEVPLNIIGFDEQEKTTILNLLSGKEKALESDKIILTDTPVLLLSDTGTD